jgi:hypothetical protein
MNKPGLFNTGWGYSLTKPKVDHCAINDQKQAIKGKMGEQPTNKKIFANKIGVLLEQGKKEVKE